MKINQDLKVTIAMVASLLTAFLLLIQFFGWTVSLTGTAIGGNRNTPPVCLWEIGTGNVPTYQLISDTALCNRILSRYAGEGQCSSDQGLLEVRERTEGQISFAYLGHCRQSQGERSSALYVGSLV